MIVIALFAAAAAVPQSLLDEADAASLAHTECEFATVRAANQARLPAAALEERLGTSCAAEERALRSASIRVFRARGNPNPDVEADRMIRNGRRLMVENYRKLPEIEAQLEQLSEICRARPEACRE